MADKRITNLYYRQFLDEGIIQTLDETQLNIALSRIKGKHMKEGRSLVIALYYTGARPNEVLRLRAKDIYREKSYIILRTPASKSGLARPIYLQYKKPLVKELYMYACSLFPDLYIFPHYTSIYIRKYVDKKGNTREYKEISRKLRYYFSMWFNFLDKGSITPYFLRHNRFTKLAENDATPEEIRILKGAKGYGSITPYLHMSSKTGKATARKIE